MRRMSFILTGLLILALSGCGQKAQTPPPAPEKPVTEAPVEEKPAETPPVEDRAPTAAELGREETRDLVFLVEGTEEAVPVTLYIGQGYSIYIPDEGWRLERDVDGSIPEDTWESTVNDDVELQVLHLGEKTLE